MATRVDLRVLLSDLAISAVSLVAFDGLHKLLAPATNSAYLVEASFIIIPLLAAIFGQLLLHWRCKMVEPLFRRDAVDLLPTAAGVVDIKGRLMRTNSALRIYLGSGVPSSIDICDFAHPEDVQKISGLSYRDTTYNPTEPCKARFRAHDGSYRWFRMALGPKCTESSNCDERYVVLLDIHEDTCEYERLKERDLRLTSILDNLPARVASMDAAGNLEFSNKWDREYHGEEAGQISGSGWSYRIHPDERESVAIAWKHSVKNGMPLDVVHRVMQFDGAFRWFRAMFRPCRDENGEVERWCGLVLDIDAEKALERELRSEQKDIHRHIDAIPTLIWSTDSQGNVEFLNRRWFEYTGMEKSEALSGGWSNVVHPNDREGLAQRVASGEAQVRLRRFDGEYRWFMLRTEALCDEAGQPVKWYGTNIDIHDLKAAQQELREAKEVFRTTLDRIPVPVVSGTPEGAIDYINARWAKEGFLPADIYAGISSIVHPLDLPRVLATRQSAVSENSSYSVELRLRRADGTYPWFLLNSIMARDETGMPDRRYAVFTAIGDRKRAEEALQARERELQQIVDAVPASIFVLSTDGKLTYVNNRMQAYYDLDYEQLPEADGSHIKGAVRARVYSDDAKAVEDAVMRSYEKGEPFAMRYRSYRFDGAVRWVEGRIEPLRDEDGKIVRWYGSVFDIHDEVVAQERFRVAMEKLSRTGQLASLSELSASIAHEINQPLAAILTNSNALQRRLAMEPLDIALAKTIADRIVRDVHAVAEIVGRVRALFKLDANRRSPVSLNRIVEEVTQLLAKEALVNGVVFRTELDMSLPDVSADYVQIQQVLVNIVRNGIEAMRANIDAPKVMALRSFQNRQDTVYIEIRDSGEGISDPERIFDPLFTTKEDGMGMGLAICRSILAAHGGTIAATRAEPRGSVFAFSLPLQPAESTST